MNGFDRAQAQYDAQTPPYDTEVQESDGQPIYDEDADCTCTPLYDEDEAEVTVDSVIVDHDNTDCRRHSEPPCERCGWQAVCPDCVGT